MYKCEICGRESFKKIRYGGYTLCSKHMHQLHKHGKFLDNNLRTNNDLNDYEIKSDGVYFNLYNQKTNKVGEFIIDFDDIEKIKYHKWRLSHSHVVTGLPAKGTQRDLSHVVLDIVIKDFEEKNIVVDHINGNPLDNRKSNLRICPQSENVLNKSFMSNNTSGFIGVCYRKDRNYYDPEIKIGGKRKHLGCCKNLKEAVYARYVAEELLFQNFANEKEHKKKEEFTKDLSFNEKEKIKERVINKIKDLDINNLGN